MFLVGSHGRRPPKQQQSLDPAPPSRVLASTLAPPPAGEIDHRSPSRRAPPLQMSPAACSLPPVGLLLPPYLMSLRFLSLRSSLMVLEEATGALISVRCHRARSGGNRCRRARSRPPRGHDPLPPCLLHLRRVPTPAKLPAALLASSASPLREEHDPAPSPVRFPALTRVLVRLERQRLGGPSARSRKAQCSASWPSIAPGPPPPSSTKAQRASLVHHRPGPWAKLSSSPPVPLPCACWASLCFGPV